MKKQFITAAIVYLVFAIVIGFIFNGSFVSIRTENPIDRSNMVIVTVSLILPLLFLMILRNLKGLAIGTSIASLYVLYDMLKVKPSLPLCSDLCGLENYLVLGLEVLVIVLSLLIHKDSGK
jgi:hypothetical protein